VPSETVGLDHVHKLKERREDKERGREPPDFVGLVLVLGLVAVAAAVAPATTDGH
jgi:hypothetical protein